LGGRAGLRYLALNDPEIAVTSRPRLSGEYVGVASDRDRTRRNITPLRASD